MAVLGEPVMLKRDGKLEIVLAALLLGVAMTMVQIAIDRMAGPLPRTLLVSDIFVGLVTTAVTGAALGYHRRHVQAEHIRMQQVAEVNHHVRNALTAISLSVYAKNDPQLEKITRESIQRIDWALREVLGSAEQATTIGSTADSAFRKSA